MKTILFLLLALLSGCAVPRIFASEPEPAPTSTIVRLDSLAQLTQLSTGKIKFKGPVTIQHGTGNMASTVGTDNTGRSASSGANGGHSSEVSKGMPPPGVLLVLLVMAMVAGVLAYRRWWPGARVVVVLLLLMPLASSARPNPKRYSYRVARQTERRYNRVVKYYDRKNRKDARELKRDRKVQAKRLKRDHP